MPHCIGDATSDVTETSMDSSRNKDNNPEPFKNNTNVVNCVTPEKRRRNDPLPSFRYTFGTCTVGNHCGGSGGGDNWIASPIDPPPRNTMWRFPPPSSQQHEAASASPCTLLSEKSTTPVTQPSTPHCPRQQPHMLQISTPGGSSSPQIPSLSSCFSYRTPTVVSTNTDSTTGSSDVNRSPVYPQEQQLGVVSQGDVLSFPSYAIPQNGTQRRTGATKRAVETCMFRPPSEKDISPSRRFESYPGMKTNQDTGRNGKERKYAVQDTCYPKTRQGARRCYREESLTTPMSSPSFSSPLPFRMGLEGTDEWWTPGTKQMSSPSAEGALFSGAAATNMYASPFVPVTTRAISISRRGRGIRYQSLTPSSEQLFFPPRNWLLPPKTNNNWWQANHFGTYPGNSLGAPLLTLAGNCASRQPYNEATGNYWKGFPPIAPFPETTTLSIVREHQPNYNFHLPQHSGAVDESTTSQGGGENNNKRKYIDGDTQGESYQESLQSQSCRKRNEKKALKKRR